MICDPIFKFSRLKEEDILEASAAVVEDLIWQSIVKKLKESSVIIEVSQVIFQLSVNIFSKKGTPSF